MRETESHRAWRLSQIRQQQAQQPQPQQQPVVDWSERREQQQMEEYRSVMQQFRQVYGEPTTPAVTPSVAPMPMPKPPAAAEPEQSGYRELLANDNERVAALTGIYQSKTVQAKPIDESDPRLQADRAKQAQDASARAQRRSDSAAYAQLLGRVPNDRELDKWIAGGRRRSLF